MRLRVATFNIHHGQGTDGRIDVERIAQEIRRMKADIIALQEVDRLHPRSRFQDQLRRLGRILAMRTAYAPSINLGFTQYGNAVLTRLPIVSKRVIFMRGIAERRSILKVRVQLDDDAGVLTLVNTHLGLLERERARQFPILQKLLTKIEEPAILMGDFNMNAVHPLMQQLMPDWRKLQLNKAVPTIEYGGEIDHIYTNIQEHQQSAYVMKTNASDHHAVVGTINW